jgi:hypothetical protein
LKPRVRGTNGRLIIDSPRLLRVFLLGAFRRTVIVNPEQGRFEFVTRVFRTVRTRLVPFSDVERLDYSYEGTGTNFATILSGSHDPIEWFTIKAILKKDREALFIGRFLGEGGVTDEACGGLLGSFDLAVDYQGDQEEKSLELVRLLQAMTGLPLT